jgi:hypothetical protein
MSTKINGTSQSKNPPMLSNEGFRKGLELAKKRESARRNGGFVNKSTMKGKLNEIELMVNELDKKLIDVNVSRMDGKTIFGDYPEDKGFETRAELRRIGIRLENTQQVVMKIVEKLQFVTVLAAMFSFSCESEIENDGIEFYEMESDETGEMDEPSNHYVEPPCTKTFGFGNPSWLDDYGDTEGGTEGGTDEG